MQIRRRFLVRGGPIYAQPDGCFLDLRFSGLRFLGRLFECNGLGFQIQIGKVRHLRKRQRLGGRRRCFDHRLRCDVTGCGHQGVGVGDDGCRRWRERFAGAQGLGDGAERRRLPTVRLGGGDGFDPLREVLQRRARA